MYVVQGDADSQLASAAAGHTAAVSVAADAAAEDPMMADNTADWYAKKKEVSVQSLAQAGE